MIMSVQLSNGHGRIFLKDTRAHAPIICLKRAGARVGYMNKANPHCNPDLPIANAKANPPQPCSMREPGARSQPSSCPASLPLTPHAFSLCLFRSTHRTPFYNWRLLDADQICGFLGRAGHLPRGAGHMHQNTQPQRSPCPTIKPLSLSGTPLSFTSSQDNPISFRPPSLCAAKGLVADPYRHLPRYHRPVFTQTSHTLLSRLALSRLLTRSSVGHGTLSPIIQDSLENPRVSKFGLVWLCVTVISPESRDALHPRGKP